MTHHTSAVPDKDSAPQRPPSRFPKRHVRYQAPPGTFSGFTKAAQDILARIAQEQAEGQDGPP